jgi:hypothetical protein
METLPVSTGRAELVRDARNLARGRMVLGAFVLAAPQVARRVFGFPAAHVNASAVAFARLYALRELVLGLQLWRETDDGTPRLDTVRWNTIVDGVDAAMMWWLVATRRDLGRGPATVAVFASVVTAQWWRLWRRMEEAGRGA